MTQMCNLDNDHTVHLRIIANQAKLIQRLLDAGYAMQEELKLLLVMNPKGVRIKEVVRLRDQWDAAAQGFKPSGL